MNCEKFRKITDTTFKKILGDTLNSLTSLETDSSTFQPCYTNW